MAGINADTAVLVQLAIDEVGLIPFRNQVFVFNFVGTHPVVLNTDNISVLLCQPVKKALLNSLLQAIDAD